MVKMMKELDGSVEIIIIIVFFAFNVQTYVLPSFDFRSQF